MTIDDEVDAIVKWLSPPLWPLVWDESVIENEVALREVVLRVLRGLEAVRQDDAQ